MALHPADSSAALKAHIKASEKLVLHAYFDPVGVTKYPDYIEVSKPGLAAVSLIVQRVQ